MTKLDVFPKYIAQDAVSYDAAVLAAFERLDTINELREMSPSAFEEYVTYVFSRAGYSVRDSGVRGGRDFYLFIPPSSTASPQPFAAVAVKRYLVQFCPQHRRHTTVAGGMW